MVTDSFASWYVSQREVLPDGAIPFDELGRALAEIEGQNRMLQRLMNPVHRTPLLDRIRNAEWNKWIAVNHPLRCSYCGGFEEHSTHKPDVWHFV